jgi:hypothetical protein
MSNFQIKEKQKIKALWEQYKGEYTPTDLEDIQKDIDDLQAQWTLYRNKIVDGNLRH